VVALGWWWRQPGKPLLFIVTNPPLAPLIGLLAKYLRRQPYILLFYDMYPEAIERFASFLGLPIIAVLWRKLNRAAIRAAHAVVTISPQLAHTLAQYYPAAAAATPRIIPTWVDTSFIRPIPKAENWFARQHHQVGMLTILYSGNLGAVHDLSLLPALAERLTTYADIHFLVVGAGSGWLRLRQACQRLGLPNLTFLPTQPQANLPFVLATADIGLVALARGGEGVSMPSKTYYTMAAGSAVLGLSDHSSDLAAIIRQYVCGLNVPPDDADGAAQAILNMRNQPDLLRAYRLNARRASETCFAKTVCVPQLLELIGTLE